MIKDTFLYFINKNAAWCIAWKQIFQYIKPHSNQLEKQDDKYFPFCLGVTNVFTPKSFFVMLSLSIK